MKNFILAIILFILSCGSTPIGTLTNLPPDMGTTEIVDLSTTTYTPTKITDQEFITYCAIDAVDFCTHEYPNELIFYSKWIGKSRVIVWEHSLTIDRNLQFALASDKQVQYMTCTIRKDQTMDVICERPKSLDRFMLEFNYMPFVP